MKTDPRLMWITGDAVSKRGVRVADAGFSATANFTFRWRLSGKEIVFMVSDYLKDAPDDVLREFADGASAFVFGERPVFGDSYMKYMTSDSFITEKRPVYMRRSRNLARTETGNNRNLIDSVQRLLDLGLLFPSDIDNSVFTWTSSPNYCRVGYCAQLFRVVAVSSALDDESIPENILDYVVYHECLHLRQGYRPFNRRPHDAEFHRQIALYPGYAEAEKWTRKISSMKRRRRNIIIVPSDGCTW